MGYKEKNKDKRRYKKWDHGPSDIYTENQAIAAEKRKARDLRNSSWCYYCGRTFPPDELTMDHKIPLARGGKSEKINIVPACKECNNKKKYLLPTEWDEYMESLKR